MHEESPMAPSNMSCLQQELLTDDTLLLSKSGSLAPDSMASNQSTWGKKKQLHLLGTQNQNQQISLTFWDLEQKMGDSGTSTQTRSKRSIRFGASGVKRQISLGLCNQRIPILRLEVVL